MPPINRQNVFLSGIHSTLQKSKIKKTRLKRLPVISREHFRKTRTNYFYKHLFAISNTNLQNGISNTKVAILSDSPFLTR
jgi:hypothetical protein